MTSLFHGGRFFLSFSTIMKVTMILSSSFTARAFVVISSRPPTRTTRLFGIEQWRDLPAAKSTTASSSIASSSVVAHDDDLSYKVDQTTTPQVLEELRQQQPSVVVLSKGSEPAVRTVPVLIREAGDLLLQGQTLHLHLIEEAEIRLFQRAMQDNERIFGMVLLEQDENDDDDDDDDTTTFLRTMLLLEIQDYNLETNGGKRSRYGTAKVVGRACLEDILQDDSNGTDETPHQQPMTVLCTETFDTFQESSLEAANMLASLVENLIADTSDIEESCRRRRRRHDDEEEESRGSTRMRRYQEAYRAALDNDSQGYLFSSPASSVVVPSTTTPSSGVVAVSGTCRRSWQELTAISWAAFATSDCLADDSTYRLSALDMDCVSNRLQLAVFWLSDVRFDVEQQIMY